jgi:predicted enzyme related to lactoylglutathione lyase
VSGDLVHLELHTPNLGRACAFYAGPLGWRARPVSPARARYLELELGDAGIGGGAVECGTKTALWLPYVEVDSIVAGTERARALGARVTLAPREGPAGWRSVVSSPDGGEIALWQGKR